MSAGLRLGWGGGLSFIYRPNEHHAVEGILSPRWGGVVLTGLYQRHAAMPSQKWTWFYGGGLHLGYHHRDNFVDEGFSGAPNYLNLGFDLIGGIAYRMEDFPLEFSLDYMPSIELSAERNFLAEQLGLTCRFRFSP